MNDSKDRRATDNENQEAHGPLSARLVATLFGHGQIYAVWAVSGIFIMALVLLVSFYAWRDYHHEFQGARRSTQHISGMMADNLGRSLGEVMLLLETVRQELDLFRHMPTTVPEQNLQLLFDERFARMSQLEAFAIFDADGRPLLMTGTWPGSLENTKDRPYFRQLQHSNSINTIVSAPLKYAGDGLWRISISQRITTADGEFGGAIIAVLDPKYFQSTRAYGDISKSVELAFFQSGNILLARVQRNKRSDIPTQGEQIMFSGQSLDGGSGTFEAKFVEGDAKWTVSYRQLPLGDLVVGAGIKNRTIIFKWIDHRGPELLLGLGTVLLLLLFTSIATRQIRFKQKAEVAAQRAELRLAHGVESLSQGFVLYDADGHLVLHNKRYREIYEEISDVIFPGAHMDDIVRAEARCGIFKESRDADQQDWIRRRLQRKRQTHSLSEEQMSSGRWVMISEHRTDRGGVIGIHSDITERKNHEFSLEMAKTAAETANRAKSDFVAMISHELRTPLNAIIGFSELIMTEAFGAIRNDKYVDYASDINKSGHHLLEVINDILDLSKAEAGKLELFEEEVDAREVIRSCLRVMSQRASEAFIGIGEDENSQDVRIFVDRRAFKQMLFNLFSNAIKFTPENGHVSVRTSIGRDGHLSVAVSDTGIGIAPEDIPKVLTPFSQADSRLSREYEGTGLGLPLVKHLIEKHDGRIELHSNAGSGTTVTLHFPAKRILARVSAA